MTDKIAFVAQTKETLHFAFSPIKQCVAYHFPGNNTMVKQCECIPYRLDFENTPEVRQYVYDTNRLRFDLPYSIHELLVNL